MDDASAIQRCQAGDVEAFRHLVDRYQAEATDHAAAILGRPEDAADAAQEAFVKAFRALGRFDLGRRFYPWFYTILRHCCFKLAAERRPTESIGSEALAVLAAPQGEPDGMVRLLERALRELPAADRELITLKHLDGLSYAELAERLEIPADTVVMGGGVSRRQAPAAREATAGRFSRSGRTRLARSHSSGETRLRLKPRQDLPPATFCRRYDKRSRCRFWQQGFVAVARLGARHEKNSRAIGTKAANVGLVSGAWDSGEGREPGAANLEGAPQRQPKLDSR